MHSKQMLLILLLVLFTAGAVWFGLRIRRSVRLLAGRDLREGQLADAVVLLSEEHPGSYLQGEAYYTFQVHVKPARGRNFVSEVHVLREQLKRIPQAGDHVLVRYIYSGRKRTVALDLDGLNHASH